MKKLMMLMFIIFAGCASYVADMPAPSEVAYDKPVATAPTEAPSSPQETATRIPQPAPEVFMPLLQPSRQYVGAANSAYGEDGEDAMPEDTLAEDVPTEAMPTETMPSETTPTEDAPTQNLPDENAATETPPDATIADGTMPAEDSTTEDTPAEDTETENAPVQSTPSENAPDASEPAESTPTESTLGEPSPYESTPPENTPDASSPAESAPTESPPPNPSPYHIHESTFVTQINYIRTHYPRFIGRPITYTGIFFTDAWGDEYLHIIHRYTMGCCRPVEFGFQVILDNIPPPPQGDWVTVTGTLEAIAYSWGSLLVLHVQQLTPATPGLAYVED